ncbi:MAG TPA: hypothetical protein VK890_11880 [Bacteroidia bacterium]|nr:hypothetical protein [Bacteroidia bacterium]
MKKTSLLSGISFLMVSLAAVLIFSCSKERVKAALKTYSPVSTYLTSKEQPEQTFVIDSAGTGPIVGNQGTKIWGSKNCLMYSSGDTVAYPFIIKLVELYTAKDMIYYQMPTVAGGTILETSGEIRLRAFAGTTQLLMKPSGCSYEIQMPCAAPIAGMDAYYGITTAGNPDWTNTPLTPFTVNPSSYTAYIQMFGWINCGQLAGSTNNSTLNFTSTTDDLTNVGIFLYFPATKTVMQAYNSATTAIPNGSSVKIVAIGVDGSGNLFSFYQAMTVSSSSSINVTLSATTDAALTTLLTGL